MIQQANRAIMEKKTGERRTRNRKTLLDSNR